MADGEQAPDPREARDPAGFVAQLRALKDWSGLTHRELSARAEAVGDALPPSAVANMLARTAVPREELLGTFVRACGAGPEALESWLAVRKELALRGPYGGTEGPAVSWPGAGHHDDPGAAPHEGPGDEAGGGASWWRRMVVPVLAGAALVVTAFTVVVFVRGDDAGHRLPEEGPVDIRAVHSGLCLNERRGQRSGQVYQVPCAGAVVPRYSLVPLDGGLWRLRSDHPDHGPGCSGIPVEAVEQDGAPLVDQECGKRGPREAFRIEPVDGSAKGYRVRSAHSGLCLEVRDASREPWTDVVQRACDDGGAGQLFSFDRRPG
ncbi:helix-turn-helix domain-containing protein [Streptomyces sp. NPDC000229]|uniref:helix-turn-helix domain-containing protein n=1 Tax=Streptomyces sp. NPDC000229 TaxID=3154247 RepID=UPI00331B3250